MALVYDWCGNSVSIYYFAEIYNEEISCVRAGSSSAARYPTIWTARSRWIAIIAITIMWYRIRLGGTWAARCRTRKSPWACISPMWKPSWSTFKTSDTILWKGIPGGEYQVFVMEFMNSGKRGTMAIWDKLLLMNQFRNFVLEIRVLFCFLQLIVVF